MGISSESCWSGRYFYSLAKEIRCILSTDSSIWLYGISLLARSDIFWDGLTWLWEIETRYWFQSETHLWISSIFLRPTPASTANPIVSSFCRCAAPSQHTFFHRLDVWARTFSGLWHFGFKMKANADASLIFVVRDRFQPSQGSRAWGDCSRAISFHDRALWSP